MNVPVCDCGLPATFRVTLPNDDHPTDVCSAHYSAAQFQYGDRYEPRCRIPVQHIYPKATP